MSSIFKEDSNIPNPLATIAQQQLTHNGQEWSKNNNLNQPQVFIHQPSNAINTIRPVI